MYLQPQVSITFTRSDFKSISELLCTPTSGLALRKNRLLLRLFLYQYVTSTSKLKTRRLLYKQRKHVNVREISNTGVLMTYDVIKFGVLCRFVDFLDNLLISPSATIHRTKPTRIEHSAPVYDIRFLRD